MFGCSRILSRHLHCLTYCMSIVLVWRKSVRLSKPSVSISTHSFHLFRPFVRLSIHFVGPTFHLCVKTDRLNSCMMSKAAYVYVHIEKAHLVDMELRPWHNIRINLSQNKPNRRSLNIKFEFFRNFWNLNLKGCTFEKNAFKVSVRNFLFEKRIFYVLFWFKMTSFNLFRYKLVQIRCLPKNAPKCSD